MDRNLTGISHLLPTNGADSKAVLGPDSHDLLAVNLFSRIVLSMYSSTLLVVGVTCNSMALRILSMRTGRRTHLWLYLMSLAVSNMCLLATETSRYAVRGLLEVNYTAYSTLVCFVHRWLVLTSLITSNWLMVFITFGKWHILRNPNSSLFKNRHMVLSVCSLLALTGCLTTFVLYRLLVMHDVRLDGEAVRACSMFREKSREYVMIPLAVFTPMLLVVALSIVLYLGIKVQVKEVMTPTTATEFSRLSYYRKLTLLLVVANIQHLLTAIPVSIFSVTWSLMFDQTDPSSKAQGVLVMRCLRLLWHGSYATNCFIMCLQGAHFRNQLHRYLSRFWKRDIVLQRESSFLGVTDDHLKETDKKHGARRSTISARSEKDSPSTPYQADTIDIVLQKESSFLGVTDDHFKKTDKKHGARSSAISTRQQPGARWQPHKLAT